MNPNFFVLGAPKCGTTALSEYLKAHPNVFVCALKEPYYFDFDFNKKTQMSEAAYLDLFREADPTKHKAVMEFSTSYLYSEEAVPAILKFNPGAKFIVMVRNPLDLVRSWHSQMLFIGTENIKDFGEAWLAQSERRAGRNIPAYCWEPRHLFYSDWGLLGERVEKLLGLVPREKVAFFFHEDLVADPAKVYGEVLKFLGIPHDGRTDFPKVNENKSVRSPLLQHFITSLGNYTRVVRSKLGNMRGYGILNRLLALNSRPATRERMPEPLRMELVGFYRKDVEKLSKLLGRDLSHWLK